MGKKQRNPITTQRHLLLEIWDYCTEHKTERFTCDDMKSVCARLDLAGKKHNIVFHVKNELPTIFIDNDLYVLNLGDGEYAFARGLDAYYLPVPEINYEKEIPFYPHPFDELTNGGNYLPEFLAQHHILQDFLWSDDLQTIDVIPVGRIAGNAEFSVGGFTVKRRGAVVHVDSLVIGREDCAILLCEPESVHTTLCIEHVIVPWQIITHHLRKHSQHLRTRFVYARYKKRVSHKTFANVSLYEFKLQYAGDAGSISLEKAVQYKFKLMNKTS